MINSDKLILTISEICIKLSENTSITEEDILTYKNSFGDMSGYEELIAPKLLIQMREIYKDLIIKFGKDLVVENYLDVLNKINNLIHPINSNFIMKYIECRQIITNELIVVEEKLNALNGCLGIEENIDNIPIPFKIEYYNLMLNFILVNTPNDFEKLKSVTVQLKNLINIREQIPQSLFTI